MLFIYFFLLYLFLKLKSMSKLTSKINKECIFAYKMYSRGEEREKRENNKWCHLISFN